MTPAREALAWTILLVAVVLAGPPIIPLLGAAVVLTAGGAIISAIYMTLVYRAGERTSWVFRMLVQASWRKVMAGLWVGTLTVAFFTGWAIPRPVTAPISAVVVIMLFSPTIGYATTIWRRRRAAGALDAEDAA